MVIWVKKGVFFFFKPELVQVNISNKLEIFSTNEAIPHITLIS